MNNDVREELIGQKLEQLDTPALVVDLKTMRRNIADMAAYCASRQVRLRPHIKTHKTPEIAKLQLEAGAVGITVAKLSEAETMADSGIKDIFIANQIIGSAKIKRLLTLATRVELTVLVDSEEGIRELAKEAADKAGVTLSVCIEINISDPTGVGGRCGIPFKDVDQVARLARLIMDSNGLDFAGILGFRGVPVFFQTEKLEFPAPEEESLFAKAGCEEGKRLVELADSLRRRGIPVEQVIGGSTPTAKHVAEVPGITEVHPGEYVFSGGTHVRTGLTGIEDCALRVMTTVVSRPHKHRAVVDGGSKTFAGDMNPKVYPNLRLKGYGIISSVGGDYDYPLELPAATLAGMNEEHGFLQMDKGSRTAEVLRIGDKLSVIPNHVCPVVNLFDRIYGIEDGKVVCVWDVKARGNLT